MEKLKKFVDGKVFQGFILFVIIVNALVLGLQTSKTISSAAGGILSTIDTICLAIFIPLCRIF